MSCKYCPQRATAHLAKKRLSLEKIRLLTENIYRYTEQVDAG